MYNSLSVLKVGGVNIERAGWKYYNIIKKKAMEQEFSMSGLIISLSIAFFIVIATAYSLNLAYKSITFGKTLVEQSIMKLEAVNIIQDGTYLDGMIYVA